MKKLDEYLLQRVIGKGAYGEVYLTTKTGTNQFFAAKKIPRKIFELEKNKKYLNNEILILKQISHPNILQFYELKKTHDNLYIMTEFCNGGSLSTTLDYCLKQTQKPFSEEIVQYLGIQICSAIQYLHNHNILHRDLKLDNILINFEKEIDRDNFLLMKGQIKIIDFGFARYLAKDQIAQSILGSPLYMDPMILNKLNKVEHNNTFGYDEKADIWALGNVFFTLLVGVAPFDSESYDHLLERINKGEYRIPNSLKLSKQAISFINSMLQYNPAARKDINELITHDFLTQPVSSFNQLNLKKAEKLFSNKDEIMMNAKQMNNIWSIFSNIEEKELNNEAGNLYQSVQKVKVEKESIIVNIGLDIVGNFLDGFKQILKPIVNNGSLLKEKSPLPEPEISDKNVLQNIKKEEKSYTISNEDKDILNNAFQFMNKDSYAIDPMFIPVIPSDLDDIFDIDV